MPAPRMSGDFRELVRRIVAGDADGVSRCLATTPALATTPLANGATRQAPAEFFITEITHYVYAGDTALHVAAAAFQRPIAELLVARGADWRAANRRAAQPLHYAADANHWNPAAQADTIAYLTAVGADPNAVASSGVTPLHRAVRTRSLAAVRALLDAGANPTQRNENGSTPLHLAVQPTGRSGAGSERAREQQAGIIALLLERGARAADRDRQGKTVRAAATSEWIRDLLADPVASSRRRRE